jgi:hypothetical protein
VDVQFFMVPPSVLRQLLYAWYIHVRAAQHAHGFAHGEARHQVPRESANPVNISPELREVA